MTHHPTSPAQIIAGPSAIPQRMRGSVRGGLRGGGLSKRPDQTSDRRDRREVRRRDRPVGDLDGKISFDREYEARHVERGEADISQIVLEPEFAITCRAGAVRYRQS